MPSFGWRQNASVRSASCDIFLPHRPAREAQSSELVIDLEARGGRNVRWTAMCTCTLLRKAELHYAVSGRSGLSGLSDPHTPVCTKMLPHLARTCLSEQQSVLFPQFSDTACRTVQG